MSPRALILGCAATELGPEERSFFRDADPWGFILFKRNIDSPGAGPRPRPPPCARRWAAPTRRS